MTSDPELLRRYASDGDEAAFAELVRRHVDLVYATALRLANGNATLAEDVTQTVFTDLARKAGTLLNHPTLTGWLHTSTRFAVLTALRKEQSRREHEQEASAMNDSNTTSAEISWTQLRPWLDEALGHLREHERDAVLLRFFQDKSYREVGGILGVTENAAQMRVERALEKLRGQFSRRNIATTATLLASVLGAHGAAIHAPVGFEGAVAAKSLAGVASGSAAGMATAAQDKPTKPKLLLIAAVLIIVVGIVALIRAPAKSSSSRFPARSAATSQVETPKVAAAPMPAPSSETDNKTVPLTLNNLGQVSFANIHVPKTFTLKSGLIFSIMPFQNKANGSLSMNYGVQDPKKNQMPGDFDMVIGPRQDEYDELQLDTGYSVTVQSGTPIMETLFNGETVTFTPTAPALDVNSLGELHFTPETPLKFTLRSGKILVLTVEADDHGVLSFSKKVYASEQGYGSGREISGGLQSPPPTAGREEQYDIGDTETVTFTPKY